VQRMVGSAAPVAVQRHVTGKSHPHPHPADDGGSLPGMIEEAGPAPAPQPAPKVHAPTPAPSSPTMGLPAHLPNVARGPQKLSTHSALAAQNLSSMADLQQQVNATEAPSVGQMLRHPINTVKKKVENAYSDVRLHPKETLVGQIPLVGGILSTHAEQSRTNKASAALAAAEGHQQLAQSHSGAAKSAMGTAVVKSVVSAGMNAVPLPLPGVSSAITAGAGMVADKVGSSLTNGAPQTVKQKNLSDVASAKVGAPHMRPLARGEQSALTADAARRIEADKRLKDNPDAVVPFYPPMEEDQLRRTVALQQGTVPSQAWKEPTLKPKPSDVQQRKKLDQQAAVLPGMAQDLQVEEL